MNEKESKYTIEKINKANIWCFENISGKINQASKREYENQQYYKRLK